MRNALVALGVVLGVILLFSLGLYGKFNGINNTAVDKETALSAQYQDNQNELSSYVSGFYEQTGLVAAKSAQMDKILTDAVKGRYDKGSTAAPVGGQLISAMIEAYPDLSGLDSYDKIMTYVQSGREAYKQKQSKLLDMLREFDKWRNTGLLNKHFISWAGVPDKNLRATIGSKSVFGAKAEKQMYLIVLAPQAKAAYTTGEQAPLTVPAD